MTYALSFSVLECRIVSSGTFVALMYNQPAPMVSHRVGETSVSPWRRLLIPGGDLTIF